MVWTEQGVGVEQHTAQHILQFALNLAGRGDAELRAERVDGTVGLVNLRPAPALRAVSNETDSFPGLPCAGYRYPRVVFAMSGPVPRRSIGAGRGRAVAGDASWLPGGLARRAPQAAGQKQPKPVGVCVFGPRPRLGLRSLTGGPIQGAMLPALSCAAQAQPRVQIRGGAASSLCWLCAALRAAPMAGPMAGPPSAPCRIGRSRPGPPPFTLASLRPLRKAGGTLSVRPGPARPQPVRPVQSASPLIAPPRMWAARPDHTAAALSRALLGGPPRNVRLPPVDGNCITPYGEPECTGQCTGLTLQNRILQIDG